MSGLPEIPEETTKRRKINVLLLIILLDAIIILAVLFFLWPFTLSPNQSLTSVDWAGYVVASDLNNPQSVVTSINASWTVPTISGSAARSFSAAWIGVGGQFSYDETLIQAGTEHDYINGQATYSAWFELLPQSAVTIESLSVSAGDNITAQISLLNPAADTWFININDLTKDQSFQQSFTYSSSMLSAEWIVERPQINGRVRNLANFGELTFTGCTATIAGKVGSISSFPSVEVTMYQSAPLVTVSPLMSGGTSFTLDYVGS